jgi:hypothetical protein
MCACAHVWCVHRRRGVCWAWRTLECGALIHTTAFPAPMLWGFSSTLPVAYHTTPSSPSTGGHMKHAHTPPTTSHSWLPPIRTQGTTRPTWGLLQEVLGIVRHPCPRAVGQCGVYCAQAPVVYEVPYTRGAAAHRRRGTRPGPGPAASTSRGAWSTTDAAGPQQCRVVIGGGGVIVACKAFVEMCV